MNSLFKVHTTFMNRKFNSALNEPERGQGTKNFAFNNYRHRIKENYIFIIEVTTACKYIRSLNVCSTFGDSEPYMNQR